MYILLFAVLFILLLIYLFVNKKRQDRKLLERLKNEWGEVPKQEYTYEKLHSLSKYYETLQKKSTDVDDITWNDLDLDRIFMLLNHTESSIGEEYLYSILRKPVFEKEELNERNRLICFFQKSEEDRLKLQQNFHYMGKLKDISFFDYMTKLDLLVGHKPYIHYLCLILLPLSFGSVFIPVIGYNGFGLIFLTLIFNILMYYVRKGKIEKFFHVFSYLLRTLGYMEAVSKFKIPEVETYLSRLSKEIASFKQFRTGAFLVVSRNTSGSITDMLLDNIRMITHVDLIKFDAMVHQMQGKKENLNTIFEVIGLLDSMIAAASFRSLFESEYCVPKLTKNNGIFLTMDEFYHPLILNPVKNSINAPKGILLTGSNASGKSTFIKTVAINQLMAQTITTSLSKSHESCFFQIFSSMALRDDLASAESYYIVEIKSLKRIYDHSGQDIPILCFVDEVLRGTNTQERIAASGQILKSLSARNALVFAATHDIELTYILEKYYENYHFEEQVTKNNVTFDYLLRTGRSVSRNAIKLLGMMGYSESLIWQAENEVQCFLEHNKWNVL